MFEKRWSYRLNRTIEWYELEVEPVRWQTIKTILFVWLASVFLSIFFARDTVKTVSHQAVQEIKPFLKATFTQDILRNGVFCHYQAQGYCRKESATYGPDLQTQR